MSKLGYYSLIFSLLFSILIILISVFDIKNKKFLENKKIYIFSFFQLFTILASFLILIYSFIDSDFSLATVYENSHTDKPLFYKISGTWGNHEGSLLLWIMVLVIYSFLFLITSKKDPKKYMLQTVIFQNFIIIGFMCFSLLTSNPFETLIPIPKQGLGLNPILQDPALAVHPPILYVGYVGSSIFFSSALSAMINNNVSREWAKSIKPWIFISWIFLTLGILLGSIWAYYELGWGGFWFWDPVENASLMPWLASTALLHSIMILEKRQILHSWTIILAIITFTLSVTGTFLVRSGILNSVHTFANDPSRGIYILIFLISLSITALIIFFLYQPKAEKSKTFSLLSKEASILINNWFMIFFLITVLIGTIYPIFLEVLTGDKISIGPPFYNFIIIPFLIPFLVFMTIGPKLHWIQTNISIFKIEFIFLFALGIITLGIIYWQIENLNMISLLIFLASLILIFSIIKDIFFFVFRKIKLHEKQNLSMGRLISHIGFAFLVLSIALNANLSKEKSENLKVGQSLIVSDYKLTFDGLINKNEQNYNVTTGLFTLRDKNNKIQYLNPEIRIYNQPKVITSEASISSNFFSDFYLTMSYISDKKYFNVRFQHKPFMFWIWISVILIATGGFFSVIFRKV